MSFIKKTNAKVDQSSGCCGTQTQEATNVNADSCCGTTEAESSCCGTSNDQQVSCC